MSSPACEDARSVIKELVKMQGRGSKRKELLTMDDEKDDDKSEIISECLNSTELLINRSDSLTINVQIFKERIEKALDVTGELQGTLLDGLTTCSKSNVTSFLMCLGNICADGI